MKGDGRQGEKWRVHEKERVNWNFIIVFEGLP
jgi:hypothetical protein